jgi:hypothetical protein
MDFINRIMPILWKLLIKNPKCKINVATIEDKLTVNILLGKRRRTYAHKDIDILIGQLSNIQ